MAVERVEDLSCFHAVCLRELLITFGTPRSVLPTTTAVISHWMTGITTSTRPGRLQTGDLLREKEKRRILPDPA